MRFFIAPRAVPVGAVEALDALEQQAIRFAVNPQHSFVTQQFIRRLQQQVFHHAGNFADIYRVIQFHHNRRNIVLFIRDKVETRFGADDVFFQHKTVGVEQQAQIDVAVGDGVDRCAGVDARQAFTQFFCFACDVGFGQQNAVGVANL
ncbi:hypothetical protein ESCOMM011M_23980 [Escherichia coli]